MWRARVMPPVFAGHRISVLQPRHLGPARTSRSLVDGEIIGGSTIV